MLTAYQIDALQTKSERLLDPINDFLIEDITKRISQAGQLTGTASYQIWKAQNLGVSQRKLKKEIQKKLRISMKEVEQLLKQAAETGYNFDISRFPTTHAIPLAANSNLQQILDATVKQATEELANITQTIGFVGPDGVCRELTQAYQQACDFAFQKVTTGAQDYMSAIRDATKQLADKGIRTINYESGVHTSMEATVRRNIMGGLGIMQEKISQQNHDDLGCDGWEISAHAASAPDHEPIQGKQYTDEEYTQLNNSLVRRIGTLNCGHAASPIVLGVNSPQYTAEELEKFRRDNETGVDFEGKHYTLYEATQRQRKFERTIRKQKRKILIDESLGDNDKLQTDQIRLVRLRDEYKRFSKGVGLPMQHERMETAGFDWKKGKAAEKAQKTHEAEKARKAAEAERRRQEEKQKHYEWLKSIGAEETEFADLAFYKNARYNNTVDYGLLRQYTKDVEAGWVSPLSGFTNYRNLYNRVQTEIVGKVSANGTVITGQVPHFMQRVIGTMVDPYKKKHDLQIIRRSGVEVDSIISTVFFPEQIDPIQTRASGKRSLRLIGEKCAVTINPDTGELIQTNPL